MSQVAEFPSCQPVRLPRGRRARRWFGLSPRLGLLLLAGLTGFAGLAIAGPAQAQSKLNARYVAKLAGIPLGRGTWSIDIADDQYAAVATGGTTGLLRAFESGEGKTTARGKVASGQPVAASYAMSVVTPKRTDDVRIVLAAGTVKDYSVMPEPTPNPARVPLTDGHRRGVIDPMTAALVHVPGTADPMSADACAQVLPVFDGQMRFDLKFAFKRMDRIKVERGYQGDAVVCAISFVPLAGHDPNRQAIKYLMGQSNMEVWLAPIAGTRVLVPIRIVIPTPVGVATLEATEFVATVQPTAPANGSKTN